MTILIPLLLILGGGISNILERTRTGYVRDPFAIGAFHFNSADICIAIGIIWAICELYRRKDIK